MSRMNGSQNSMSIRHPSHLYFRAVLIAVLILMIGMDRNKAVNIIPYIALQNYLPNNQSQSRIRAEPSKALQFLPNLPPPLLNLPIQPLRNSLKPLPTLRRIPQMPHLDIPL